MYAEGSPRPPIHSEFDLLEGVTGLSIQLYSELRFVTMKGCMTRTARRKDAGRVWSLEKRSLPVLSPSCEETHQKCEKYSNVQCFCPGKPFRDSVSITQAPSQQVSKARLPEGKQAFSIIHNICTNSVTLSESGLSAKFSDISEGLTLQGGLCKDSLMPTVSTCSCTI